MPGLIALVGGLLIARSLSGVHEWHVMTDEMLYPKLAYGVLDGDVLSGSVRGVPAGVRNMLFPVLISPFLALMSVPEAFHAIIALNAFLFASAAIPTFLLARHVLPRWGAYLVAAMAIALPWAAHAGSMLTEATGYAAITWAVWGMHRCLLRPGWRSDLLALALLFLAYEARTQFIVLAPLLPAAVILHELPMGARERKPGSSMWAGFKQGIQAAWRNHRLLWVVIVLAAAYAVFSSASSSVLGSYSVTADGKLLPPGIWRSLWLNIANIGIGLTALPVALAFAWILNQLWAGGRREAHALAVVVLLALAAVSLAATSFSIQYSLGYLQERYIFYIAPLLLVGFGAFFAGPRRLVLTLAGTAAAVYVLTRPAYDDGLRVAFASVEPAFYVVLRGRSEQLAGFVGWDAGLHEVLRVGLFAGVLGISLALRYLGTRVFAVVGAAVLIALIGQYRYVLPRVVPELDRLATTMLGSREDRQREWVDRATSPGDKVGVIDSQVNARGGEAIFNATYDSAVFWDVEFWNKRITSVWGIGASGKMLQPTGIAQPSWEDGSLNLASQDPVDHLVMSTSDTRFAPDGEKVASVDALTLYRVAWPPRAAWMSQRIGVDGWTEPPAPALVRVFGRPGDEPRRWELMVRMYAGDDIPGGRRVAVRFGASEVSTIVTTVAEARARACVPPGGRVDAEIVPEGTTDLGGRGIVGIRVITIAAEPTSETC